VIDEKLITVSFDGTLRVWDASGLFSEQVGQIKNEAGNERKKPVENVTIENEKSYNIRLNSSLDKRSDADSGIDEREFIGKKINLTRRAAN
jgi:hypothetical protein